MSICKSLVTYTKEEALVHHANMIHFIWKGLNNS
jgi:hypothetical protein